MIEQPATTARYYSPLLQPAITARYYSPATHVSSFWRAPPRYSWLPGAGLNLIPRSRKGSPAEQRRLKRDRVRNAEEAVEVSSLALVARPPATDATLRQTIGPSSVTAKPTATCERLLAPEYRGGTIPERLWKRAFVLRWRIGLGQIDPRPARPAADRACRRPHPRGERRLLSLGQKQ
jgi:hypothetical protein